MRIFPWISDNWFTLLQSLGIIAGMLFTGVALKRDARSRQVANLIELTKGHREIWSEQYRRPELARVSHPEPNLVEEPITVEEELFIGLLILHLSSAYHAIKGGMVMQPDGLKRDIQQFFSRPIAKAVWEKMKPSQDLGFVLFIETAMSS